MKHKRSINVLLTAALLSLGLTGCAENQIPDLTDEEVQAVGEFVAITMMKYDMNHKSRLMNLTAVPVMEDDAEAAEPEPEASAGMGKVDDTPVVNSAGAEAQMQSSYSLEEVIGLPVGVTAVFQEYTVSDSYPDDSDILSAGFSLDASAGKKLLVLHFLLTNTTEQEQNIDLFSSNEVYTVTVNETYTRRALTTMLLEDLTTYQGTLPANGSSEAVLVIEAEQELAGNITSVSLKVKNEEKEHTIQLLQ